MNITSIEPQKVRMGNDNELNIKEKEFIYLKNEIKLLNIYFVHDLNMDLLLINALLMNN